MAASNKNKIKMIANNQRNGQRGFVFIPVVMAIFLIAAIAYLINLQGAMQVDRVNQEIGVDQALYTAQAGISHMRWQTNKANCTGYANLSNVAFGNNSYSGTVNPSSGSPVSISVTGTDANGANYSINRDRVNVYQSPVTLVLQPDAASGKDAYLWYPGTTNNYGSTRETWVSTMSNDKTVALYQFDLSAVPAGVKILSATLSLYHLIGWDSKVPISAHRITNAWNETEVSWDNRTSTQAWNTPAGDFDSQVIDTTLVGPTSKIRYEWQLKNVVQKWVNGSLPNYGVLLRTTALNIDGEKFASSDDNTSTKHPRLTITYACECGVICTPPITYNLLLVVVDPANLTTQEAAKKTLFESWGYAVSLIDVNDTQSAFDTAVASNDVVYITEDIVSGDLGTKLVTATIGVVTEEDNLSDEFGLSATIGWESGTQIEVNDNTHYITSPFTTGLLSVFSSSDSLAYVSGTLSPNLDKLASSTSGFAVVTLDTGAATYTGGSTVGRRVQLPWGGNNFDVNNLTADGQTILKRALEWARTPAPPKVPVAHWKLDETSGTTAFDSVGGHDGTLVGNPAWSTGTLSGALDFDGSGDRIDAAAVLDSGSSQVTVTAWVFKRDTGDDRVISKSSGTAIPDHVFSLGVANTTIRVRLRTTDNGGTSNYDGGTILLNQWTHLAFTYDGTALKIYKDGIEAASYAVTGDMIASTLGVAIGNVNAIDDRYWNGLLDDVRVYDRALYPSEILGLANSSSCNGTYRDEFNTKIYSGSDGSIDWSTDPWAEIGESDGSTSGNVQIKSDTSNYQLHISNTNRGVERTVDLNGAGSAVLSFDYRRKNLDNSSDYVAVYLSSDGGALWTELAAPRIEGGGTDSSYQSYSRDISAFISNNTMLRLKSSSTLGSKDDVYFDNIQIQCSP